MAETKTNYRGYTITVHTKGFVVYDDTGAKVGEAWSMAGTRALIRKLRRKNGQR